MRNYALHFDPVADMYQPRLVSEENETEKLPLLLELDALSKVRAHLNRLPQKDYDFETYCLIVAGACALTMKYGGRGAL